MPYPYCSASHGRPVRTAKLILPLFVLLGGIPAFAVAQTTSPAPKITQPTNTIPEPSPLLRGQDLPSSADEMGFVQFQHWC